MLVNTAGFMMMFKASMCSYSPPKRCEVVPCYPKEHGARPNEIQ